MCARVLNLSGELIHIHMSVMLILQDNMHERDEDAGLGASLYSTE